MKKLMLMFETIISSLVCDKNLLVGGRKFPVSTAWLSMCSPVFAAMFQVDMKERAATDVPIGDVRSANHFEDFLAMISPGRQMLLNRKNILLLSNCYVSFEK